MFEKFGKHLGRRPSLRDVRDFQYRNYLRKDLLPVIPTTFGHQNLVTTWGMLANDRVGDCVIASSDHLVMLWSKEGTGTIAPFTDSQTLSDYSACCGYDPRDPNTDNGCEMRTAMKYMQSVGMVDAKGMRHQIGAYASLDVNTNDEMIETAYLFGGCKVGLDFPESAMEQFDSGKPWSYVRGSPIIGGHDVPVIARDSNGILCVTWGQLQYMTAEFLNKYSSEAWVGFSKEFLNQQGLSPEGFNVDQLNQDLYEIAGIVPPTPEPTPTPTPPPEPTPTPTPTPSDCDKARCNAMFDLNTALPILKLSTSKYVKQAMPYLTKAVNDLNI